jgi:hypothetical protein
MLAVVLNIPGEWLAILAVLVPVAIYLVRRRDSQSCTLTESRILTEKSVRNIEELWDKRDKLTDQIAANRERIAYLEGYRDGEKNSQKSC